MLKNIYSLLFLSIALTTSASHAGYLIAGDSQEKGVIRMSYRVVGKAIGNPVTDRKTIVIELCNSIIGVFQERCRLS